MALCRHHLHFTSYVVRSTSVLVIDSLRQRSVSLHSEECIRYENNVKAGSVTDTERRTLTLLADMKEIPQVIEFLRIARMKLQL